MNSNTKQQPRSLHPCNHCDQEFGRKEHLDRHVRSHLQLKPFKCTLCTATFARRDTLARHSTVHGDQADEVLQSLASQSTRSAQACQQCAQSKQRCQGSFPCQRCMKKKLTCCPGDSGRKRKRSEASGDLNQHGRFHATRAGTNMNSTLNLVSDETNLQQNYHGNTLRLQEDPDIVAQNEDANSTGMPTPETVSSVVFQCPANVSDDLFLHSSNNNENAPDISAILALDANENNHDLLWTTQLFDTTSPLLWTYLDEIMPTGYDTNLSRTIQTSASDADMLPTEPATSTIVTPHSADEHSTSVTISPPALTGMNSEEYLRMNSLSFPTFSSIDHETLPRENFCHLTGISLMAYEQSKRYFAHLKGTRATTFPTVQIFHTFAELYFEHFSQYFPFVHPRQLEQESASWLLLTAVVSVGAQYSSISDAEIYVKTFHALLEQAVQDHLPHHTEQPSLSLVQTVLIRDINLTFCGLRSGQLRLEYRRNMLFTLQLYLHSKIRRQRETRHELDCDLEARWDSWIMAECFARLTYCINRLQCLQAALFDLKPVNTAHDLSHQGLSPNAVWKCRTAREWLSKYTSSNHKATPPRFRDTTDIMISLTEERLNKTRIVSERFLTSRLRRICSSTIVQRLRTIIPPQHESTAQHHLQLLSELLDSALEGLLMPDSNTCASIGLAVPDESTLHIMSILRHVRLRDIYAFSGWQADESEILESRRYLQNWIDNEQESVRKCIWHAGSAFRLLRNKTHMACFEPFNLLIAGLTIWTYCILQPQNKTTTESRAHHPVRIDQLTERREVDEWIQGQSSIIHLTGVGTLFGHDSARRLMAELCRILLSKVGWTEACRGIAFAIEQVLSGKRPSFREEHI